MPTPISDKKLWKISKEIGPDSVMALALSLEVKRAEATNLKLDCHKIICKAMKATPIRLQVEKLRKALIASGLTEVADKHLPEGKKQKQEVKQPKTEVPPNPPRKRKQDPPTKDATPAPKKKDAESKLVEMETKLEKAEEKLGEMQKEKKDIEAKHEAIKRKIKQQNDVVEKAKSAVAKQVKKNLEIDQQKIAKRQKYLEELENTPGTTSQT